MNKLYIMLLLILPIVSYGADFPPTAGGSGDPNGNKQNLETQRFIKEKRLTEEEKRKRDEEARKVVAEWNKRHPVDPTSACVMESWLANMEVKEKSQFIKGAEEE